MEKIAHPTDKTVCMGERSLGAGMNAFSGVRGFFWGLVFPGFRFWGYIGKLGERGEWGGPLPPLAGNSILSDLCGLYVLFFSFFWGFWGWILHIFG